MKNLKKAKLASEVIISEDWTIEMFELVRAGLILFIHLFLNFFVPLVLR
jgi:hypothetical protein